MIESIKLWNPRIVGLIVGTVISIAVVAAFSLGVVSFGEQTYHAEFQRSGGARMGDEVRIAGVGVGKVTEVALAGDRVLITFNVDGDVRLGAETRAQVKLATLLGNTYLEVSPEGRGTLPEETIPLAHTSVTFDVQRAIEAGGTALGKLDGEKFRRALATMADTFEDTPESVRLTLDSLGRVSRVLSSRDDEIAELIQGASEVVTTLEGRSESLVKLMDRSDVLMSELLDRREALHDLIAGTRAMARQLSGLVADNASTLQPMLDQLIKVTDMLEARSDEIDRGLRAIAPAVRYYANASGNGPYGDAKLPYVAPDNALCRSGAISPCS